MTGGDKQAAKPLGPFVLDDATREVVRRPEWVDVPIEVKWVGSRPDRALRRLHIHRLGQLANLTVPEFLDQWFIGSVSLEALRAGVARRLAHRPPDRQPVFQPLVRHLMEGALRDVPLGVVALGEEIRNACVASGLGRLGEVASLTHDDAAMTLSLGGGQIVILRESVMGFLAGLEETVSALAAQAKELAEEKAGALTVRDVLSARGLPPCSDLDQSFESVSARDIRFGSPAAPAITLAELLEMSARRALVVQSDERAQQLADRISLLIRRIKEPIQLLNDLQESLPRTNRATEVFWARWGWDGAGTKTLEQVGQSQHITRERVRQIAAKVEKRLTREDRFLPSVEALASLVRQMGVGARWDPLESTCRHASLSIL